jgi:hypothetical protein
MDCISRKAAKAAGLKRYMTGKPCPQGHVCERLTGCRVCVRCMRSNVDRWMERNPQAHRQRMAEWRKLNIEKCRLRDALRYQVKSRKQWALFEQPQYAEFFTNIPVSCHKAAKEAAEDE